MKLQNNLRIFIVDDDPFWAAILQQILSNLGYSNIYIFMSGEECLKHLHLNPVMVFLDYQMSSMDGLEVLHKIKDYFPGINVIFCTALEDISVAIEAINWGCSEYLLKSNANRKVLSNLLSQQNLVFN
jgi:CheY-like chemotaxis protein